MNTDLKELTWLREQAFEHKYVQKKAEICKCSKGFLMASFSPAEKLAVGSGER